MPNKPGLPVSLPVAALLVYSFLIPFESILLLSGFENFTMAKTFGIITMGLMVIYMLARRQAIGISKAGVYWIAFFCWAMTSVFWAYDPAVAFSSLWLHIRFFLLYIIITMYAFGEKEIKILKNTLIVSSISAGIFLAFAYTSQRFYLNTVRASIASGDLSADPNHVAGSLILPLVLLINDIISRKGFIKVVEIVLASLVFYAMLLTGSRSGLLGIVSAMVFLFFAYGLYKKFGNIILLIGLLAIASLIFGQIEKISELLYERFIFTGNIEAFSSGRLDIWTDGIKAWLKKPFLGYGFGNFSSAVIGIFRSAHNIYLQILVELGIPGLIVLLLALFKSFNLNLVSALGRGANAALFGIVALSFGLGTFNYDYFWMTLVFTAIVARFERVNS